MEIIIKDSVGDLSAEAADFAAAILVKAIEEKGRAHFIAATGASQFEFLKALVNHGEIDWSRCVMFHLDEYVGISMEHPASFRRYLTERLIQPAGIGEVRLIEGDAEDLDGEISQLNERIRGVDIDIAFVGIGENGHLAFNDPPADFDTEDPYLVVDLDRKCRRQQVNEGWFASLEDVPEQAVSMSVKQIMKSREIVCVVPGARKEEAVTLCLSKGGEPDPMRPASALVNHARARVYLDAESSRGLTG